MALVIEREGLGRYWNIDQDVAAGEAWDVVTKAHAHELMRPEVEAQRFGIVAAIVLAARHHDNRGRSVSRRAWLMALHPVCVALNITDAATPQSFANSTSLHF